MQSRMSAEHEPRVVTIHVRRRRASLLGLLVVLGMVLALVGSARSPRASVVLAADAPHPASTPAHLTVPADGTSAPVGGGPAVVGPSAARTFAGTTSALQEIAAGADLFRFPSLDLATQAASAYSSSPSRAGLSWPLHAPVASGFGPRIHPVLGREMFHTGLDLMAACGTPIRAAADGQVVYAAISASWGRRVILRHSTSLETGYAHMSRFLVRQGDVVKRGQILGLVGTTGWSTGCHLHFDVIVRGNYVDPAPYLGLPGSSSAQVPYHAAPHVESSAPGRASHTVEDGDVPVTSVTRPSSSKPSAPRTTTKPSTTPATSKPPTSQTTTAPSTTTSKPPTTTTGETNTGGTTTSTPPTTTTQPPKTTGETTTTGTQTTTGSESQGPTTSSTTEAPSTTSSTTTQAPSSTTKGTDTKEPATSSSTPDQSSTSEQTKTGSGTPARSSDTSTQPTDDSVSTSPASKSPTSDTAGSSSSSTSAEAPTRTTESTASREPTTAASTEG